MMFLNVKAKVNLPVVVLEDHLNKNTAVFCRDQGLGNPWQAQLLNGHQYLLAGAIYGFNQPSSMSSPLRHSPVRGER